MKNEIILGFTLVIIAMFTACAQPRIEADLFDPENHFLFEVIDSGTAIEIIGYVGGRTDVRIPPYIRGLPVTVIGEGAFLGGEWQMLPGNNFLTWVYLHPIASVTIPNGVIRIGSSAFAHNNLTEVTIPGSVAYMGLSAFAWSGLLSVTIEYGIIYIGSTVFNHNRINKIILPCSVTHIEAGAFMDNQLTSVAISDNVIYIGWAAFRYNYITSVYIPNSHAYVHEWAFDPKVSITRY